MLAPPPDLLGLDKTALEPEGKRHYLQTLENRLKKLEGRDGNKLTSKDMLSALSEARDDHLSNAGNESSYVNEYADWQENGRRITTTTTCCCGCWGRGIGRGYLRVGQRREFNMEEYTCLVDCDELETRHDNIHNDNKTNNLSSSATSNYGFDDNFVTD